MRGPGAAGGLAIDLSPAASRIGYCTVPESDDPRASSRGRGPNFVVDRLKGHLPLALKIKRPKIWGHWGPLHVANG